MSGSKRQEKQATSALSVKILRWQVVLKVMLFLVLLASVYGVWLQSTVWLPFKQIEVTGILQQVSSAELREVVAPLVSVGFIRMDVLAVRDAVKALPWVSEVTVRRQWPDTLALEIEEQQLLARWGDVGLINQQGELFYPENLEVDEAVPRFYGVEGVSSKMAQGYLRYQDLLQEAQLSIVRLDVSARRAWSIKLNNGVDLLLGREPPDQYLQRFIEVYRGGLAEQIERISRVDLRYSNGFAVRWKENKAG